MDNNKLKVFNQLVALADADSALAKSAHLEAIAKVWEVEFQSMRSKLAIAVRTKDMTVLGPDPEAFAKRIKLLGVMILDTQNEVARLLVQVNREMELEIMQTASDTLQ